MAERCPRPTTPKPVPAGSGYGFFNWTAAKVVKVTNDAGDEAYALHDGEQFYARPESEIVFPSLMIVVTWQFHADAERELWRIRSGFLPWRIAGRDAPPQFSPGDIVRIRGEVQKHMVHGPCNGFIALRSLDPVPGPSIPAILVLPEFLEKV